MLKTDLNSTRSELQAADTDFQKSLSDVNTTLKTGVSQSIAFNVCRLLFKFVHLDGAVSLPVCFVVSLLLVRYGMFNFRFKINEELLNDGCTCNAKTQITELWPYFMNRYQSSPAGRPFPFFATKLL